MLTLAVGLVLISSGLFAAEEWPVGRWTGTWEQQGGESGALKITIEKKPDGSLGGSIQVEMNGAEFYTADFQEVSQTGNKMTIKYDYPSAPVQVLIEGEWRDGSLSGTWGVRQPGESEYQTQGVWKATKP
jgi:hypothetical protein